MKAMTQQDIAVKPTDELGGDQDQQNVDPEDVEASAAAQMEWDPQTDVASPMLSLQGFSLVLKLLIIVSLDGSSSGKV